jgi:hypothetical protein
MTGLARSAAATIRRRASLALLLTGGTIGVLALVAASRGGLAANAGSKGVSRVEVRLENSGGRCNFDWCAIGVGQPVTVTTPSDVDSVDIVVTVTAAYSISRGDSAWTAVGYRDPVAPPPPCPPPQPDQPPRPPCGGPTSLGSYPMASPGRQTSTTLTWFKRDLPAAGRSYAFSFGVSPRDVDGNHRSSVVAKRVVFVTETWSAGD